MRVCSFFGVGALALALFVSSASSTMLMTSLLMSLKGGMILNGLGLGGLLMMMMAGQQYNNQQQSIHGKRSIGLQVRKRMVRSIEQSYPQKLAIEPNSNLAKILSDRSEFQRQMNILDPLRCLPKLVCGLNLNGLTAAPSSSSSLMNDLAYLVQVMRDDDDVDSEEEGKERGGDTKKSKEKSSDEVKLNSSEEEELDDDEYHSLKMSEKAKLEEMAEEALLDEEPELLGFVLKDMKKKYPGLDVTEKNVKEKIKQNSHRVRERNDNINIRGKPEEEEDDFKSDPFFADLPFRRRRSFTFAESTPRAALEELAARRARQLKFVERKKREYEQTEDLLKHVKIASDLRARLRSPRQCRAFFGNCPYTRTEIEDVIVRLQNVLNSPAASGDKVVHLKQPGTSSSKKGGTPGATSTISSSGNVINIQTGISSGYTQISHELGNGNKVEILLRVNKNNKTEAIIKRPMGGDQVMLLGPNKNNSSPLTAFASASGVINLSPEDTNKTAAVLQRLNETMEFLAGFENETESMLQNNAAENMSPEVVESSVESEPLEPEPASLIDDEKEDKMKNIPLDEAFAETAQKGVAQKPKKTPYKVVKNKNKKKKEEVLEETEEYDDASQDDYPDSGPEPAVQYDDVQEIEEGSDGQEPEVYDDVGGESHEIFFVPYRARRPSFKMPPKGGRPQPQHPQHQDDYQADERESEGDEGDFQEDDPNGNNGGGGTGSVVGGAAQFLTSLIPARFRLGQQSQQKPTVQAMRPYIAYGKNPYPSFIGGGKRRRKRPQNPHQAEEEEEDSEQAEDQDNARNKQKDGLNDDDEEQVQVAKQKGGKGNKRRQNRPAPPQPPPRYWNPPHGQHHPDMFPKIKYSDVIKSTSTPKRRRRPAAPAKPKTPSGSVVVKSSKVKGSSRPETSSVELIEKTQTKRVKVSGGSNMKQRRRRPSLKKGNRDDRVMEGFEDEDEEIVGEIQPETQQVVAAE